MVSRPQHLFRAVQALELAAATGACLDAMDMTVAELLAASRVAHQTYRQVAARGKKPEGWQAHLWDALHSRREADRLDPAHVDSAWDQDRVPHAELVAFYERQLGLTKN